MINIPSTIQDSFKDLFSSEVLSALKALSALNEEQKQLMQKRNNTRKERHEMHRTPQFLNENDLIPGTQISVAEARAGKFEGATIPDDLKKQWIQGTGPATRPYASLDKSLRNVAYALLSGADGWMCDGEDALGQIETMSLDNIRNIKLALEKDDLFMSVAEQVAQEMNSWSKDFLHREIIQDWKDQLDFTTIIYRARGLHLDDRHITCYDEDGFSASITDLCIYVVNVYELLLSKGSSVVLYLPKIQTAEEAAFWNKIICTLEAHLDLNEGTIKCYVLIEQLEQAYQLMEIRAVLGQHFVGFNTGRWDYINSVSDALAGDSQFINPNIESIGMTYSYMAAYEDRVRRAVNTADINGHFALWQGGMEPNIPVGSEEGVQSSMSKALAGAQREQKAGASGKWVAHWKMVHLIRPVWEEVGEENQLGRPFPPLDYTQEASQNLYQLQDAPRTIRGARNLLSVALQYGNAFLQGQQAAALKPADYFGNDHVLYLMEDAATGEIRVSVLWEWLHKKAQLTDKDEETGLAKGAIFDRAVLDRLLNEEYEKLLTAADKDVYDASKKTTLPIAKAIVSSCVTAEQKAPWYIDLLNLNLNNTSLYTAEERINLYFSQLKSSNQRITRNLDLETVQL